MMAIETHWNAAEELNPERKSELELREENLLHIDEDNPLYPGTDSLMEAIHNTIELLIDALPTLEQREKFHDTILGHLGPFREKRKERNAGD